MVFSDHTKGIFWLDPCYIADKELLTRLSQGGVLQLTKV